MNICKIIILVTLIIIGICLTAILYGITIPALISAQSTELVIIGIIFGIAYVILLITISVYTIKHFMIKSNTERK